MLYPNTNLVLERHRQNLNDAEHRYQTNDQYLQYLPTTTLLDYWKTYLKRLQRRLTDRRPQKNVEQRQLQLGSD
jgi:hypothetical protein